MTGIPQADEIGESLVLKDTISDESVDYKHQRPFQRQEKSELESHEW
jgi:hypothetical protein